MVDTEINLRVFQQDAKFICRPTDIRSKPDEPKAEYVLQIETEHGGVQIDLTDTQRKALLLELHRAPRNETIVLFAGYDI